MARSAFRDPRRARVTAVTDGAAVKKPIQPVQGSVGGINPTSPFRVRPRPRPQGVPASALPGTVNQPVTPVLDPSKPDVYSPKPVQATDNRAALASVADKMKTARESGDLGTLLKTTSEEYLPQLQTMQTSIGNVDTGQVARILGEDAAIPQDLPSQQKLLTSLAQQLQTARETGDLGTANRLGQQYRLLVQTMQGQVTGKVVTGQPINAVGSFDPVTGQPVTAASTAPVAKGTVASTATGAPTPDAIANAIGRLTPEQKAQYQSQWQAQQAKDARLGMPPQDFDTYLKIMIGGTFAQEQTAAGGGPPPDSTVPSGEGDVTNPPPSGGAPTGTFDAAQSWSTRLQNSGLVVAGRGGRWVPDSGGAQKIQSLIDYDQQFVAGFPPEGQAWVSSQMALEQRYFDQAIAQYPDQWDKIFRDHQTRVKDIQAKWETDGKWEAQLQAKFDEAPPETKVKLQELMKQGNDAALNAALEDLKAGKDPVANIDKYLAKFGADASFELAPGEALPDYKLDQFEKQSGIDIAGADNVDLNTDKSRIDAALQQSTLSEEGKKALGLQLETIQKRLTDGGGGFGDDELKKMLEPIFSQIDRDTAAQITAASHDLAAQGITGPSATAQLNAIRDKATNDKKAAGMELVKQNMGYKQSGTSEAISALGDIATSERGAGLTEKELALSGATTQTELTSEEKRAQAQANLAQKALNQEGELSVWGKKVDENLEAYGFKLDQYKSDKGFDLARYKTDLDERVAQGELDVEEAKLAYSKVKDSIDSAQKETDSYDRRNEVIAGLRQRAAEGDQDAEYRVQALEVQQELTALGIKTEHSDKIASLMYGVRAQGLQLSQEWKMFIEQMAATKEAQESSGFMDFVGTVVGGIAGSFAGGVGASAGAAAGKAIF